MKDDVHAKLKRALTCRMTSDESFCNVADVSDDIAEFKRELGVALDRELADRLGLDASTIAGWRRRGAIPDRYRFEMKARVDRDAEATPGLNGHGGIKDAFVFALIREVVLETQSDFSRDNQYESITFALRLAKLYDSLWMRFQKQKDRDALRPMFESLRNEIRTLNEDDLAIWIETGGQASEGAQ